jgi:hypothetical protein
MTATVIIPFGARYLVLDQATFEAALAAGDTLVQAPNATNGRGTCLEAAELVDAAQLARVFSLRPAAVLRLARDGVIPVVKVGRLSKFDIAAVRAALDEQSIPDKRAEK